MNFVCVVIELCDKMLTLSSMENLIVPCNLKRCQYYRTWLLVVCHCKGIKRWIELVNMWILFIETNRL